MKSASRKPQPKRKYFKSRGFSRLFCFSWEQRKLKEIADKVTEKNGNLTVRETFTNSAEYGIISQRDFFDHDISNADNIGGYYVVRNEDFVYNPRISVTAPVGPINRNKLGRNGVMSPLYTVFRTHDIDTEYLEWFFKSDYWHSFMNFNGDSGARSDRFSIKDAVFFEMPIPLPSIDEQRRIGALLNQINNLITLHQRDSIMRFFGAWDNANAWEQRKYGEVVETRRGLTYKPSDICYSGIRVLRSSNIDEDTFVLKADDVFVKKDAVNIDYSKENDILITSANGSSRLVGKHAIISSISGNPAVHGGFMLLGTTKEPYFINASMGSSWYRRFIELYVAGGNGAIGNLNKNDLDNQVILIPSEPEQRAIGAFFKQLDHLITLHQRERKNRLFGGKNVKQYNFSRLVLQLLRAMDSRLQRRGSSQGDYG